MTEELTLSLGDTPASRSARQGKGKASLTPAISGWLCLASLESTGRVGLLAKMLLVTSAWDLTMCWPTWKVKRTKQYRLLFQLAPLAHPTGVTESGLLLPTPRHCTAMAATITPESAHAPNRFPNLKTVVGRKLWPTPKATLRGDCKSERKRRNPDLVSAVNMWTTPQASDNRDRGNLSSGAVKKRAEAGKQLMLSQVASDVSGKLNPQWVEWLMGYPKDWTLVENPPPNPMYKKRKQQGVPTD